jgi:hypothetical protein
MEAMRVNWTDDRLGDRFDHVDERFDRVETHLRDLREDMNRDFARVDADMNRGFARVDANARDLRTEMNERFDRLDARFDAMQRTLFLAAAGIVAALIGLIATQL